MAMSNLPMQLERLRRHYEVALQTYDAIALVELSHTLRIWADLRSQLSVSLPQSSSTLQFRIASPARSLTQTICQRPFVMALLPGALLVRGDFSLGASPGVVGSGKWHVGARIRRNADAYGQTESSEVSNILIVQETAEMDKVSPSISRVNFPRWLDGESVRLRQRGTVAVTRISNEEVTRRVANTLDGSHPRGMPTTMAQAVDAEIKYLFQVATGQFTLPYAVLLKAAQDILTVFTPWLISEPATPANG